MSLPEVKTKTFLNRHRVLDVTAVMLIIVAALWGGHTLCFSREGELSEETKRILFVLRPAVLYAAGAGFYSGDCSAEDFPALEAFLHKKQEISEINPEAYPEHFSKSMGVDGLYGSHVYLNAFVGILFRLFGISNHTLNTACIILHIIAMVLLYFLFRIFLGSLLSFAVTSYLSFSPALLIIVPDLRDYGKFPFFIAVLLLLALILKRKRRPVGLFLLSAILGAVIGVGWGFRDDLLICVPMSVLVVFLLSPCISRPLLTRTAAAVLLLFTLALVSYPVRQWGGTGEMRAVHTLLAGITETPEEIIWFGDADYDFGYLDYDEPVAATVSAFAARRENNKELHWFTPEYSRHGRKLFEKILQTVPADFFARGLSMVTASFFVSECFQVELRLKELLIVLRDHPGPSFLLHAHDAVNPFLNTAGLIAALITLVLFSRRSPIRALTLSGVFLYFTAYPSLLAEYRHFFHLFFIPLLFLGFAAALIRADLLPLWRKKETKNLIPSGLTYLQSLAVPIILLSGIFLISFFSLLGIRAYQSNRVQALAGDYESLNLAPVEFTMESDETTSRLLLKKSLSQPQGLTEMQPGQTVSAFLAIRFKEAHRVIRFSLLSSDPVFFKKCTIRLQSPGVYYFPAFDFFQEKEARFTGLEFASEDLPLVEGIYEVEGAETLPLWLSMALSGPRDKMRCWKSGLFDHWYHRMRLGLLARTDPQDERMMRRWQSIIQHFPEQTVYADAALRWATRKGDTALEERVWSFIGCNSPERRSTATLWFYEKALEAREKEKYDTARHLFEKSLEISPGNLWSQVFIGTCWLQEGNEDAAKATFKDVLTKAPDFRDAAAFLHDLLEKDDLKDAETFWKQLAEAHPEAAVPRLYHGLILEKTEDTAGAQKAFEQARDMDPGWGMPPLELGRLSLEKGLPEKAMEYLEEAWALEPELSQKISQIYSRKGQQLQEEKDWNEAAAFFEKALEVFPQDLWNLLWAGEIKLQQGKEDAAITCFKEVLTRVPGLYYAAAPLHDLLDKDDSEKAMLFWKELAAAHPDAAAPRLYQGLIMKKKGDREGAKKAFELARNMDPDWGMPLLQLGCLLLDDDHLDRAAEYMEQALILQRDLETEVSQSYTRRGQLLKEDGNLDGAVSCFEKALEVSPQDFGSLMALGETRLQQGKEDAAAACFKEALITTPEAFYPAMLLQDLLEKSDLTEAETFWLQLAEAHPDAAVPRLYHGLILKKKDNWEGAKKAFELARNMDPVWGMPPLELGRLCLEKGLKENAGEYLEQALTLAPELAPEVSRIYSRQGELFQEKEDWEEAVACFEKAREVFPQDLWSLIGIGEVRLRQGKKDNAITCFKEVLTKAPLFPHVAALLHDLLEQNNFDETALFWKELKETHPDAALPRLYHGLILKKRGNREGAQKAFEQARDMDPDWGMPPLQLGSLFLEEGPLEKAAEYLEQALTLEPELAPKISQLYSQRAQLLQKEEEWEKAVTFFEKALEISPQDLWNLVWIGEIRLQLGNKEAAITSFKKVLTKAPESPHSAELLHGLLVRKDPEEAKIFWKTMVEMHPHAALPQQYLARLVDSNDDKAPEAAQADN